MIQIYLRGDKLKERIKELRKIHLGLTLEKFGEFLGVTKTTISRLENGVNSITEQMIKSICNVSWEGRFVNEQWLRTGEGSVFAELPPEDEYTRAAALLSNNPLIVSALIEYQKLPDDKKAAINQYALAVLNRIKEHEV